MSRDNFIVFSSVLLSGILLHIFSVVLHLLGKEICLCCGIQYYFNMMIYDLLLLFFSFFSDVLLRVFPWLERGSHFVAV